MAKHVVLVNDAAPGAVEDSGITSDGTTITNTKNYAVGGTLAVTGNSTLGGTTAMTGNVAVNTDKFTVAAASGNTAVAGTLGVTGAQTNTGILTCNEAVAMGATENAATSGVVAIPITKAYQGYTTNGTAAIAATLADGTVGQRIWIDLTLKDTNNMVITPANFTDGTTLTFDATGEYAELMFVGTSWKLLHGTATVA